MMRSCATAVLVALTFGNVASGGSSSRAPAAAAAKRAIFWRGDLVVFNSTALDDVLRRGFSHTVVKLPNESQWLCQSKHSGTALYPLLDVSRHNPALSLRQFSPYTQADELQSAGASLRELLRRGAGCLAGVVDDVEQLPFPTTMYMQAGGPDSYHSNNFSDLVQMIGSGVVDVPVDSAPPPPLPSAVSPAGNASTPLAGLWRTFTDWPSSGGHAVPNLTMTNIEFNYPQVVNITRASAAPTGRAEPYPQVALTDGGPRMVAQLFSVEAPSAVALTRADIVIGRPAASKDATGDPLWEKAYGSVRYLIAEVSARGVPDLQRIVLSGGSFAPAETNAALQSLPLFMDPSAGTIEPHRQYAFVLQWEAGDEGQRSRSEKLVGGAGTGYLLACSLNPASSQDTLLVANTTGGAAVTWRPVPGASRQQELQLTLYTPKPPASFGPNQMRSDWVAFRVAVMAGYIEMYSSLVRAASSGLSSSLPPSQEIYIYSGYLGNPRGYPRTSHNPSGHLNDSYSVDWTTFAAAGLDVAICGYGTTTPPEPTLRALAQGSATTGKTPTIICGSKSTQAVFADRYAACNGGAMALSTALDAPDFRVPRLN
jgi:hypothetical protein